MQQRETLSSRLGFILLSAGCAIGLGNVWRFPFITGKYGGATFVLIYLAFLAIFGLPIMVMEFAIGRASRKTMGEAYRELEPKGSYWHLIGPVSIANSYILMMYYTTITGWLLSYFWQYLTGKMANLTGAAVTAHFSEMLAHPLSMALWMALSIILGFLIGSGGLQKGVETVTKKMMAGLLVLIVVLAVHSLLLPGGKEGLAFYLKPSLSHIQEAGLFDVVFAAMSQAFFTLSIGMGSMTIFGSYIDKDHSLTGESVHVIVLDTFVALTSGLIIFPACSRLWCRGQRWSVLAVHLHAQHLLKDGGRALLGCPLLSVHELRRHEYRHHRAGEHYQLLDRPQGNASRTRLPGQRDPAGPALAPLRPRLQRAFRIPSPRSRKRGARP